MSGEGTDRFLPGPQETSMTRGPAGDQGMHKAEREGVEEAAALI